LIKTLPLKYKNIFPQEKYLTSSLNPPMVKIEFFDNLKNINEINCYSNEQNIWKKSKIKFLENNIIEIELQGKFVGERGRINCSKKEVDGFWRWLGIQFVVSEK